MGVCRVIRANAVGNVRPLMQAVVTQEPSGFCRLSICLLSSTGRRDVKRHREPKAEDKEDENVSLMIAKPGTNRSWNWGVACHG